MKKLLLWLAAAVVAQAVLAQDQGDAAAQRARIAAERAQVETRFRTDQKDCYGLFAVNDCLNAAKARRREAMADLRRQEISLNDAERKRKGAERQRQIEEHQRETAQRSGAEKKQASPEYRESTVRAARPAGQGGAPGRPRPG